MLGSGLRYGLAGRTEPYGREAGSLSGLHIAFGIADQKRTGAVDREDLERLLDQSRFRLATTARTEVFDPPTGEVGAGEMGTGEDAMQGDPVSGEILEQTTVQGLELGRSKQTPSYRALVGDDDTPAGERLETKQCVDGILKNSELCPVGQIAVLFHEHAVPVEE